MNNSIRFAYSKNKFVNNSFFAFTIPVFRGIIKQKLHKECLMKKSAVVAERLKKLREGSHLSQAKLAEQFEGVMQSAVYRYESAESFPPYSVLMQYADFFDVSLDYIFGRTDNPQGKLYKYQPKIIIEDERMQDFIEMCFDPNTEANAKLKQALLSLLEEQKSEK